MDERREDLKAAFTDPKHELYIGEDSQIPAMLEDRDFYTMANVFWVPESARWEALRNQAKQPDIGKRIDDALIAIEQDNARLKAILDKRFARTQLEPGRLGELIDLISSIGFGASAGKSSGKFDKAKDTLGEVYEYFLGQFASAEGKKGGQFYTPPRWSRCWWTCSRRTRARSTMLMPASTSPTSASSPTSSWTT